MLNLKFLVCQLYQGVQIFINISSIMIVVDGINIISNEIYVAN